MLNFDLNNDAVFAGVTVNGADLTVVAGRDHRCLPRYAHKSCALQPSGKRLLTAHHATPAVTRHWESEDMSMSSRSRSWQRQQGPAPAGPLGHAVAHAAVMPAAVTPAIWASLMIQQAL
jgi:hypothetical protein